MDCKALILRSLHSLLLFVYAGVTWLLTEFFDVRHIFNRMRNGALNSTDTPFLYVDRPIQNLDHIAFVISEDNLSIPTICQLILICINLQIRDVSITAELFSNSIVWKHVQSCLQTQKGVEIINISDSNEVKNVRVFSKDRSSVVHFLNPDTGQQLVSKAAKHLAFSPDPIIAPVIDKTLQRVCPMSPVSLTVIFGPPSLSSLLPWHSQETEILKFPSHKIMDSTDFINILHVYSGITKRWGR